MKMIKNKIIRNVLAAGALWAIFENFILLTVRRENMGGNIHIVHLSDFHKRRFGRNNSRLIKAVKREKPDIIFLTGDLVSRDETDFTTAMRTIDKLCMIAPTVMIYGNHEMSLPDKKAHEFREMLSHTDVILLQNDYMTLNKGRRSIRVYGLCEKYSTYKKDGGYRDLDRITSGDLEEILGKCPSGEVILLAHNPLFAKAYAEWGADNTLSGHIHGGAVRLFGKGILSPERKFLPKYSKGKYTIGKMNLLVSAGLGKRRLFDPAEIVVYDM